jgi:DNA polymerase-3 subunit beta
MKFTCKKDKLKEGISKIERVVSKQTTLPVLGNILIKSLNGQLLLMATNLELAIKVNIGAKIEEDGSVTLPPRILSGFLNNIKDDIINCEIKEDKFYINSENHNIQIKTLSAKDFPIIPEMPENPYFKIKSNNLIKAINGVNISVAHKDTRQELNGVFVKFSKDKLIIASTDSFRLSEVKVPIVKDSINDRYNEYVENESSIIMPINIVTEIQQLDTDNELDVLVTENQIFINSTDIQLTSQLINGHYPDYKQIIPSDCENKLVLNKGELLEAVKVASLVTNNQNGEVKISKKKNDNFITVMSQSVDLGENISTVRIDENKSEFEVYFNHRYIIEGLNCSLFIGEKISMEFKQEKSPVLFKAINKGNVVDSFIYMVMPIIK